MHEVPLPLGLYPEWATQDAVLITWPHAESDWREILPEVEANYLAIATAILRYETLVVVLPEGKEIASQLPQELRSRLVELHLPSNDTWARDYAPLCCSVRGKKRIVDFRFNGWGLKFASNYDNMISRRLHAMGFFAPDAEWCNQQMLVLEGGSIDANSRAEVLTTRRCLTEPNRNIFTDEAPSLDSQLASILGVRQIIYIEHGAIEGDDTDGHVDTLVRFIDDSTLAYVAPTDPNSINYQELRAMEEELLQYEQIKENGYRLLALPDVATLRDENGEPLPATYANFLFVNGALLVPTYGVPQDKEALEILQKALPDREVVGINCRTLTRQHGSLHCATMQFPKGFIALEYLRE